ncbi:MAG: T9SS type A sorting domain-containing protein [Candidatus Marinimicrobia bacterium]|nr:T9SS type A sorting domain-containing protein [Candidatus Neomarinimicrobiota bacterium]
MKRIKFLYIFFQSILLLSAATWTRTAVGYGTSPDRPVITSDPMGYLHVASVINDVDLYYATNQSGSWGEQVRIAHCSGSSESFYIPTVAVNEYGFTAIAARFFNPYSGHNIYTYDNIERISATWTKSAGMGDGHYHACAVQIDSENDLHVFGQEDNSGSYIYYQTLDPGNRIANTVSTQFYATTIGPNDTLYFLGTHDYLWFSKYNGTSWSAPDSLADGGHPSIFSDQNGNLHLAFYTDTGTYYMNNTSGSWSAPSHIGASGYFPDVVIDENGKAHIVYKSGTSLYYVNNISGSWSSPENVGSVPYDRSSAYVERKIALDLKRSTVNIVYVNPDDSVIVASTDDYELRASVSNDITSVCTSLAAGVASDTVTTNSTDTLDILEFSIKDLAGDGLATNIEQIIFQKGPAMDTDICFNDIFGTLQVDCSDGSTTACTTYASKVFAGTKDATWKSVPSNDSLNFTLRGVLKDEISGVNEKKLQFKINGLNDVLVASSGSQMDRTSSSIVSDTLYMNELYSHFDFYYLGSDFAGQSLGNGMFIAIYAMNNQGETASNFTESVTLSAVQLDGTSPASSSLASTVGLTKTFSGGLGIWMNLTYPTAGEQFRVKASSSSLTSASDTLTSMPYRNTLIITKQEAILSCLDDLGIQYDHYDDDNNAFPTGAQLDNYNNLLLFTGSNYSTYLDTGKIRTFLSSGSASERNNVMAMGISSLGNAGNSPFARDLFAGTISSSFSHSGDGISGVSQDPVTNGLSLSISSDKALYDINATTSDSNYTILTEDGTGNCVGVKRRDGAYRTIFMTPNFWDLTDDADRDSLISKSMTWLTGSTAEVPLPITLSEFTALQKGGNIELKWITGSETNNAAFLVYRNNELIARIEGAGTTSGTNEYVYLDNAVIPGKAYTYVLADIDYANGVTRHENLKKTITIPNVLTEEGFIVRKAYPNPFNPITKISCKVNADCELAVNIYNLLGQQVTQLHNGYIGAGAHYFNWDARNVTSGIYIVSIQADDFFKTQKVVLLK